MANSSILGGEHPPSRPRGTDVDALGPSDSSDSGSDVQADYHHTAIPDDALEGALPISHRSTSDVAGTGERASADASAPRPDADLLPDRVGIPADALEVAVSLDDPEAATADELAVAEDSDDDDDSNEDRPR